eukprot:scpid36605/ scgid15654/ 
MDDKHLVKVGEPGFPVAAVDRGRSVVVGTTESFQVADHDFTKLKITPSVALVCETPNSIEESFYRGKVYVSVKHTALQPSSPLRHAAELKKVLRRASVNTVKKPILLLYTDGGPDHRVTYVSVQVSLMCLFKSLGLDYLVAMRTAPMQSYRNIVERVMSILNLGMQAIGMMRSTMADDMEKLLKNVNSMAELRAQAERHPALKDAVSKAMEAPMELMSSTLSRLKLKDEPVTVLPGADDASIDEMWEEMKTIDPAVSRADTTQLAIKSKQQLQEFYKHCCHVRHYAFTIKKCGEETCEICGPPVLPSDIFSTLAMFPDPVKKPGSESYLPFAEVWGKATDDSRPSARLAKGGTKPDQQREGDVQLKAETARLTVVCSECAKPRCVFSSSRLKDTQQVAIRQALDDTDYVCGAALLAPDHELHRLVVV